MSHAARAVPVLATLAALAIATPASADGEDARRRAAESYRGADAAFKRRDYAASAAAFEVAAGFVPHPAPLLAAADAWERAGEVDRAAEDCDRALALPNVTSAEQKDGVRYERDARACVARLAPRIATLEMSGASTFAVRIDGGAQDILPAARRLKPGRHTLAVTDLTSSESRSFEIVVSAGESRRLDLGAREAPPVVPPSPPPAPPDEGRNPPRASPPEDTSTRGGLPTAAWAAFGVGAAGAIATSVLATLLVDAQRSYEANRTQAGRDDFYQRVLWMDVALGITAASVVTGVVLWLARPTGARARGER